MGGGGKIGRHRALSFSSLYFSCLPFSSLPFPVRLVSSRLVSSLFASRLRFSFSFFFRSLSLRTPSSLFSLLSPLKARKSASNPASPAVREPPPFRAASSSFDLASQPRAEARVAKNQRKKEQRLRSGIKKTRWRPPLHRAAPSLPRTPPGTPPSTWVSGGPSTARWVGSSPPQCSFVSSA